MLKILVNFITYLPMEARGWPIKHMLDTKLGITLYKDKYTIVTYGMINEVKVCE